MRTATLANLSPLPRRHWGVVTFPAELVASFGVEATFVAGGRRWRAVRGRTHGCRTIYRVRAELTGSELTTGQLVNEPHADATSAHLPHRWVGDDVGALIPKFGVRVQDGLAVRDHWAEDIEALELIEASPAHQRWRLLRRIPELGVYFEWWADVLHDDPAVPIFGKMVWSHRADSRPNRVFQFLAIESGELIAFDFARRHGMLEPMALPNGRGWLHVLNREPVNLQDGAGLPFSGSVLAFVQNDLGAIDDPSVMDSELANLRAAALGPVFGVSHEWEGRFLANRNLPRFRTPKTRDDAGWQAFLASMLAIAGWTAPREFGSLPSPGSTGDQEDFGATKGTLATVHHDPRAILRMRYSAQAEILRGVQHYEDTGRPLRAQDHPNWVTWSGGTHWHPAVSQDRLGKMTSPAPVGTGYLPHDDQHRSHNLFAAYIALGDDPFADDLVRHLATIDEAAYRVKFPQFGVDAARAQGRVAQALAQLASVVDATTASRLRGVALARLGPILTNPLLSVAGPMRVLAYGDADGRKDVFKPDGTRGPWVSLWEHGLGIVGLYVAWKELQSPELLNVVRKLAETLARFGCFLHTPAPVEGQPTPTPQWWSVADILWTGGDAPAAGLQVGSRAIVAEPGIGGVLGWLFAGMLVAREVLGPDHELAPKLRAYTDAITGQLESDNRREAEWWAVVRSVVSD